MEVTDKKEKFKPTQILKMGFSENWRAETIYFSHTNYIFSTPSSIRTPINVLPHHLLFLPNMPLTSAFTV